MESAEFQTAILALNPDIKVREKADRVAVVLPLQQAHSIMQVLRTDPRFAFDMLCAHTAIDWPAQQRIELVYQLYSTSLRQYLMVSIDTSRSEGVVPSVADIWAIAEWQEREIYDLFGVRYSNHPDLRRLLLEDDWKGHPLLKDYKDDFMLERPW
ncbi:NADH-quinone oxidoreductase subunit C [Bdellovibrionota bacterium FG-1]